MASESLFEISFWGTMDEWRLEALGINCSSFRLSWRKRGRKRENQGAHNWKVARI